MPWYLERHSELSFVAERHHLDWQRGCSHLAEADWLAADWYASFRLNLQACY